jgi:hypothetical protein
VSGPVSSQDIVVPSRLGPDAAMPAWRFERCGEARESSGTGDCSKRFSDPRATDRVRWLENLGPRRFGVSIHFTEPLPGEVEQLAEAFKIARMDIFWHKIEVDFRGVYDWSHVDVLVQSLEANRVTPLFILDYGNPLYETPSTNCTEESTEVSKNSSSSTNSTNCSITPPRTGHPFTEESREAFVKYATTALRRYRDRGIIWELYNEPNGFWANWGELRNESIVGYTDLLNRFGKAVRSDEEIAGEILIGPATSGIDLEWIREVGKEGPFQWLDGISVHPYRKEGPEGVREDYGKLRALIRQLIPSDKAEPALISSEWGWATCGGPKPIVCPTIGGGVGEVVSLHEQASRLVRQWLVNDLNHIALSIWYSWKNDGDNALEAESNYGATLNGTGDEMSAGAAGRPRQRKPSYFAARTMQRFVAPRRLDRVIGDAAQTSLYTLRYTSVPGGPEGDVLVMWLRTGPSREITLPFDLDSCMAVVSFLSDHVRTVCPNGSTKLMVTVSPQYLVPCSQSPFGSCDAQRID